MAARSVASRASIWVMATRRSSSSRRSLSLSWTSASWAALSLGYLWARGLPDAILRFAAEALGRGRPADVRSLARWSERLEVAVGFAGFLVLAAIGWGTDLAAPWALAGFATAMGVMRSIPLSLMRALLDWRRSSLIGVISGAVTMVATVVVLAAGGGIAGMFAVEAVAGLGATVYARRYAVNRVRSLAEPVPVPPELRRRVTRYAWLATIQALFAYVVWQRSEFLLLDHFAPDAQIAMYSVAFGGVAVLVRLLQGFTAVVPGSVATLHGAGAVSRIRTGFGRGVRLLIVATLPVTLVSAAIGPATVQLVYGDDYHAAGQVLVVLLAAVPAAALYSLVFGLLQGLGQLPVILWASAAGTVADVLVALALVPDHGAIGAAYANGAAQVVAAAVLLVHTRRMLGDTGWAPGRAVRALLASSFAGAVGWLAVAALPDVLGVLLGGAAAVTAYAALVRPLRLLSEDDAQWLVRTAGRFGRYVSFVAATKSSK